MSTPIYDDYYVYAYVRDITTKNGISGSPYYIGKGRKGRAYSRFKRVKPPKNRENIIIIMKDLTESVAFEMETYFINLYGRLDNNTGILHNKTDGGEGTSGAKFSAKSRIKMSKAQTGKVLSEETRKRVSINQGLIKPRTFISPENEIVYWTKSLKEFSIAYNLNYTTVRHWIGGRFSTYKGWKVI